MVESDYEALAVEDDFEMARRRLEPDSDEMS